MWQLDIREEHLVRPAEQIGLTTLELNHNIDRLYKYLYSLSLSEWDNIYLRR